MDQDEDLRTRYEELKLQLDDMFFLNPRQTVMVLRQAIEMHDDLMTALHGDEAESD